MAIIRDDRFIRNSLGVSLAGAKVFYCTQPASYTSYPPSPLATTYSNSSGTVIAQPIIADGYGHVDAYLDSTQAPYTVLYYHPYFGEGPYVLIDQYLNFGAGGTLSILSFTGGQSLEIGQTVTNPAFAATYSGTPQSASIINTAGISSPYNLTAPFESATIPGAFSSNVVAIVTFTLQATNGANSPTATQSFTWGARIFGGAGTAGATSATASGTTAVLVGATGTLATIQLGAETVGESLGSYTLSAQNLYLLLSGGSHTFTDANTGFPLAMNAPISISFTNQYGLSVPMYLYQSTNSLTGTFAPKVAS